MRPDAIPYFYVDSDISPQLYPLNAEPVVLRGSGLPCWHVVGWIWDLTPVEPHVQERVKYSDTNEPGNNALHLFDRAIWFEGLKQRYTRPGFKMSSLLIILNAKR